MAKIEENQKKESRKENKCLFYKKWWFWIIISSILCCVNIAYAIWGCKTTNKSDILTAISGWISGVATLGVGLIAYRQNKVYKEENDKIEELHRQCDWRKEQKEIVKLYLENIIKAYEDLKEYQYSKVIEEMIKNNAKSVVVLEEMIYDQALKGINDNFISIAVNSIYYFEGIEELLTLYGKYCFRLRLLIKKLVETIKNGETDDVIKLRDIYRDLLDGFHHYIAKIQLFLTQTLTNDSFDKAECSINEKRVKQIEFCDRIKKAHQDMIDKWENIGSETEI